jgi:hypothetical protein
MGRRARAIISCFFVEAQLTQYPKRGISMKTKFCALLVGASLFALAGAANAGQPLTDSQMDRVTAGVTWLASAAAPAAAFGNFDANTLVAVNTFTSQVEGVAVSQAAANAEAASAVTQSILAVGSQSAAACIGCGG